MTTLNSSDLTIKVGSTRGGENTSTVKVAWCLSKQLSDYLTAEEARDPHVVLFVTHDRDGRAEPQQFQVVPLHTGLTYIGLRHAGINTIHATVVWRMDGKGKPSQMISCLDDVYERDWPLAPLRAKRDKLYRHFDIVMPGGAAERKLNEMMDRVNAQIEAIYDGPTSAMMREHISYVWRAHFETSVDVDVPKEMFAREPWAVQRWLANFASKQRKIDECHSRKYALYGLAKLAALIVVSPLIAAFWLVLKTICAIFVLWHLLWGSRFIGYRALFSWRMANPFEVSRPADYSIWWYRRTSPVERELGLNTGFRLRHPIFLLVNPPVILGSALVAWAIIATNNFWVNFTASLIVGIATVVVTALWFIGTKGVKNARVRQEQKERERLAGELAAITCDLPQQSAVVNYELKPRRQTVRLAFLETKSWVCKPFSQ